MNNQNEFRPGIDNYLDRSQPITTLGFNHHGSMFFVNPENIEDLSVPFNLNDESLNN